ncbi:hypothetical protein [Streptomyces sp. NPDC001787]|uniref:hypothetical protein n=1 Tax=Streptomyces sp. NPDC001787 TaxID=3154523 RepID=UPI00331B4301
MSASRTASSRTLLPDLERRVLALLAEGHGAQETADLLGLASTQHVQYRVHRIIAYLGLEAATRPQLVDRAYTLGALPAPDPLQPIVLKAEQDYVVRMVAADGTRGKIAQEGGLTPSQAAYLSRKAQAALGAATLPALVRRAWERQVLGSTAFASDVARMRAQRPAEPEFGGHVIVPLASGHGLALPARRFHPGRYLDVDTEAEAAAAARFLSCREGYTPLRVTPPERAGGPFRVSWGRPEALPRPRQDLHLGQLRHPPPYRSRPA